MARPRGEIPTARELRRLDGDRHVLRRAAPAELERQHERRIDEAFFSDLILMISEDKRAQRATAEEIRAAAKAAHALEFIDALPEGFATMIGENGVKLSGGQRQRLAIARAILKDAPILILDEATSALDAATERKLQGALEAVMEGRTTFVIAHRLSTIRDADLVVVLEHGRIVEQGDYRSLIATGGAFARLVATQQAGIESA